MIDPDLLQRALVSRIESLEVQVAMFDDAITSIHALVFPTVAMISSGPDNITRNAERVIQELARLGVGKSRANGDPDAR